jgi:uncharacterized membrane-anchored protein
MNVRAAALMTTALFVAQAAFADVVPPKPEQVPPAAQPVAPEAVPAQPAAPAGETAAPASGGETAAPAEPSAEEKLASSLVQRDGTHELPGGKARVAVGEGFAFLDAADAKKLLTQIWGNPPDVAQNVLGAIVPKDVNVLAKESWAAILTYEDEGHVADDDAQSINYTDLMKEMQDGTVEENKEREKAGYEAITLVGWAQEPKYDASEHKLYWAKHLRFGKDTETLNYAIRALGRDGVLQVNVVGGMEQLADINGQMPKMLSMVAFTEGNRYADYKEGDKLAAYGIAGLIAGGVAAKAGLFKVLLGLWKPIAIGLVAVGGLAWRFLGGLLRRKSDGPSA